MARIELHDVSLHYPIMSPTARTLRSAASVGGLIRRKDKTHVEVCALNSIELTAEKGERIGVLGHNGSGKTTLLKVVAGVLKPQQGTVYREGHTVAVINPSIGLEPTLSGYENIEVIALLSGMSWPQARSIVPDVEEFTELGGYLGLPVATYSAGMKTRLAFAVATSFHPEILVADENLATGDSHFIAKAKKRMNGMMAASSIVLLASHSLPTIREICNRVIVLRQGKIVFDGPTDDAIKVYQSLS